MVHTRLWLVVCAWCLICCRAPVQASWEAYQQAGEAAYSRGRYTEAERMFLAAVREARHFDPQDPRLDISLNQLVLLRVRRGQQAQVRRHSQRTARHRGTARHGRIARRGHQRQRPHMALQRAKPGQHQQARRSGRHGERRPGTRVGISRPAHQAKPAHTALRRARLSHRAVPSMRHERRLKGVQRGPSRRVPSLRQGRQWQRPHVTIRRAGPQHPGRRARYGGKHQAARSPRQALLHAQQPLLAQLGLQQGVSA